ncbi:hypothetical protein [Streptomyces sp. or3]|uniref:hypothetical protein n=1 Tax=Streptomyces sp. or3 TaxID=1828020 RepID=UPI00211D5955|nr:hypothetical protein [Streptomyces sp. or3]
MTTRIERLIQQLDDSTGPSYDARAELICIGSDAIPALIDGLPSLGGFGQLTAIEVFEEVADPCCGPALIALLSSNDSTVREMVGHGPGEPEDRRLGRARAPRLSRLPGTSDATGLERAGGIRWALTELGARAPVVPPKKSATATSSSAT